MLQRHTRLEYLFNIIYFHLLCLGSTFPLGKPQGRCRPNTAKVFCKVTFRGRRCHYETVVSHNH